MDAYIVAAVDFHCHLDLYPDHEAAIARAEDAGVYTLTVTTTPKAWPRNFQLTRGTRFVRAALGLHPQLAAERAAELPLWEHYLSETRYIGEVGLDAGPRFYKSLDIQKKVFRTILERCAEAGGKILTVHSVRSVPAVLDMVEQHLPQDRGVVVLHWFTGSRSDARRAETLGCYFSVNAEMMRSERGRQLVAELPSQSDPNGDGWSLSHRLRGDLRSRLIPKLPYVAVARTRNTPVEQFTNTVTD